MFDHPGPRLFGLPPGVDMAEAIIDGLASRLPPGQPEHWARVTIFVNTRRMQRRLIELFDQGPPRLLPRIRLVTDLADDAGFPDIPRALPALNLKLDLAELLGRLIDQNPGLAPRSAVFDLAESLAGLIDEMHGEGVGTEDLSALDVGDFAEHMGRSLGILRAAFEHFGKDPDALPGAEARRRRIVEALGERWHKNPPKNPIIVAGSTGSRGSTRLFMEAVARLPEGAVVLPGFDFDQPSSVWNGLDTALTGEDHPQFRFRTLMNALGVSPEQVARWTDVSPPAPETNKLISLALRPAPITDQWMVEGKALSQISTSCANMTLIEAPEKRAEAGALALRLRQAVQEGKRAALITPDRMLTRRVAAALDKWGIEPDDSAGEPLHQTAPGRFLRQVANAMGEPLTLANLLAILKHPLTASSSGNRGPHLRWTREMELFLRRRSVAFPTRADIETWAQRKVDNAPEVQPWMLWLSDILDAAQTHSATSLSEHLDRHLSLAETLTNGPEPDGPGGLWDKPAGREARRSMDDLLAASGRGGHIDNRDYLSLIGSHLRGFSVQDPTRPHPDVMIWGTLEARVQGADLVLLAGLNDGVWPELPAPDPWLNRRLRHDAGLLLPDRRIGLSAHDFQMASAAKEVIFSRSLRDEDCETVPSRWLNRINNLLSGLGDEGVQALDHMRERGQSILALARELEKPAQKIAPASRPSPRPPVEMRPNELAVTSITRLIRDPYAIYARFVLRLQMLNPLCPQPDARERGTALHRVMEDWIKAREGWADDSDAARTALSEAAQDHLVSGFAWPAVGRHWQARFMLNADNLIEREQERLRHGSPVLMEEPGGRALADLGFRLTARPDRIDRLNTGDYAIYDYKSGALPSADQVRYFEKQLLLEAAILEGGGFDALAANGRVGGMTYIGLGSAAKDRSEPVEGDDGRQSDIAWAELAELMARYSDAQQGYTSRRAVETGGFEGDYDHLARYGEWELSDEPVGEDVGS